jgi:hypothetical protein
MPRDPKPLETRIPVQNGHETDGHRPSRAGGEEHEGATEDEVTPTSAPSGPEFEDEPKQG